MEVIEYVSLVMEKARKAQKQFEAYTQEHVDEVVRAVGKAVYDNAEMLARMAVDETRMGNYEDKILKNKGKSKAVWYRLKGQKSVGIIRYLDNGIVEVAKPMGVIGAVTPITNPVMTPMQNAMIALKGRNVLVICPHPRAKASGKKTVEIMNEALRKLGAPENLIQIVDEPNVEISGLVMKMADVCISTGGPGMVKVAYSSGKPAFGVGAGNVQCLIDTDVDINSTVSMIVCGRSYDNGVLCTCEQSVICHRSQYDKIVASFEAQGAYYVHTAEQVDALRRVTFIDGVIKKDVVGASAKKIAQMAGITVNNDTKVLIVKANGYGKDEVLGREKLFPVLAAYSYDTWEQAVEIANANLEMDGKGHSVVIHSNTKVHVEYAAENISVSRFLVNQIGSSGLGGTYNNGLAPTATLGCGSWGNNSLSENLWFNHLINISRIAYIIPDAPTPTDESIWN
jgi:NAD-dependent aldehyde dehydrogenases